MSNLEQVILRSIITDEKYMRKVLPFLKPKYFRGNYYTVFKLLCRYVSRYNRLPTLEAFQVELNDTDLVTNDEKYTEISQFVPELFKKEKTDEEWLLEKTEEWCQERALHIAIMDSISIIDGKHDKYTKTAIPDLLTEALGVSFDAHVGHDYFADVEKRFEFYHEDLERLPFDLEYFNKITKGGLVNKSLNVVTAGTGVGKSLFLCHCAASWVSMGYDVLYITAEMSEERIAERIDSNLLDVPISKMQYLSKEVFTGKVHELKAKTLGNLIIKEYPTGQANASHVRALLNELKLKKNFKPRVLILDYLNIFSSARLKQIGGSVNSYSFVKAIAEEFRGLGMEFDIPVLTATQLTRSGFSNSDPGLEDTAESWGLPNTADLQFVFVTNEELEADNQIMVKQLKNRYNDKNYYKKFIVGIDRPYMRMEDAVVTGDELQDAGTKDDPEDLRRDVLGLREKAEEMRF